MLMVYTKKQFLKRLEDIDNVICFGAGKRIEKFKEFFNETAMWDKIKYFVDNDKTKHNLKINLGNKEIEIISFRYLKIIDLSKTIFYIICADYSGILEQIRKEEKFENIETYCLAHQLALEQERIAMKKQIPESLRRINSMQIPKVIHYCWFGESPLPDKYKKYMESWRKFCPDYEIIEWNENNYDIKKYKYMEQAYKQKKWGFVPDIARLDIIYKYGGIYLDTDVELVQNLDELLWQKGFAGFESKDYVNLGLGFGAIKRLPIIKEMLKQYEQIEFINEDGSLNLIASPIWQTDLLKKKGLITNGEYQIVDDLTIFPEKVLSAKNVYSRRIRLLPYTKSIHHYEGSWLDRESKDFLHRFEAEMNSNDFVEE